MKCLLAVVFVVMSGCSSLGMGHKSMDVLKARYANRFSRFMVIDGTPVHYRIEGNPDGPTLVLVHAVMASMQTWDGWVHYLGGSYRIVRLDMPGNGLTGPLQGSNDYSPEHMEQFFSDFVDAIKLDHFYLAGNSQGAMVAWMYALHHPERVDKLVLIQPLGYPQRLPPIINFMTTPGIRDLSYLGAPRALVTHVAREVYADPDRLNDGIIERYYDLSQRQGNRVAMMKTLVALRKAAQTEHYAKMIPEIKTPMLIEWGAKDKFVPRTLLLRWHHDQPTAPIIIYPWGGHVTMEEVPMQSSRDADRFFQGLPIKSNMWSEKTLINPD